MDIQSAFYSGLSGYNRASDGVTQATWDINQQTTSQGVSQAGSENTLAPDTVSLSSTAPSLISSLVRLNMEELNAQANVKSIQAADELLGTVIDIRV